MAVVSTSGGKEASNGDTVSQEAGDGDTVSQEAGDGDTVSQVSIALVFTSTHVQPERLRVT